LKLFVKALHCCAVFNGYWNLFACSNVVESRFNAGTDEGTGNGLGGEILVRVTISDGEIT